MKIAVIGANGKAGKLLVKEALQRGHEVTAIVRKRDTETVANVKVLEKDLFELTYSDLQEYDVIIDAFGTKAGDSVIEHQTSLKHLADLLADKDNRLLVVGGAGSLYIDAEHKVRLLDTPDFPDIFNPTATSMAAAFEALKKRDDVKWTYLSPASNFVADGKRTGSYKTGNDEMIFNKAGESYISYADYAIAMIDEAEQGKHIRKRFTVVAG